MVNPQKNLEVTWHHVLFSPESLAVLPSQLTLQSDSAGALRRHEMHTMVPRSGSALQMDMLAG